MLVAMLVLSACGEEESHQAAATAAPPPAVIVAQVGKQPITPQGSYTGRIVATDKVQIVPRIEGFIQKRAFEEGAVVKQGDVLFEIERTNYVAAVQSAQGNLARAQAAAKQADLEVNRQTSLVKSQATAQARLDQAVATQGDAQGAVMQAEAAVTQADLNLSYTTITAPITGRISQATLDVGALVTPQSGMLATIVAVDPMYATFPVSTREILAIRKEMAARGDDASNAVVHLTLADGTDYAHPGKIDFVDVSADQATDTVVVRAEFPNPDNLLVDGQIAKVTVEAAKPDELLVVQQSALLFDQQGTYVLTVKQDDTVEVRHVEIGQTSGTWVAVTKGLDEGDRVIVDGVQKARPGQKVTATEAKSS
ncbi:MAG TPA: efflux RND transporter periplasmic adaptor subunit [Geminicoccus sp.]|uniref:efflux RND transporter periplasmic adaptor subunit n=1 Tax=Geminicoccus sp. TaxID=2024832 RepID=UPI002E330305|nr:efflux RND transporter periplasmic adaptor subunit [Geminicoccus sp.]HEX2524745.1 efflux RND transporter periplasmic adaptor subunit [Geminicoccus sp.]